MADDVQSGEELSVLLVEDSVDEAFLVLRELQHGGFARTSRRVQTEAELRDALRDDWQIAIVDYRLPGFGGVAALRLIQTLGRDLPAVLMSGAVGEEVVAEAMKTGAADYLLKSDLRRLVPAVRREVPYRPALPLDEALSEVRGGRDTTCDADAVDACLRLWDGGGLSFSVAARHPE